MLTNGFRFISYVKNIGGSGKIGMNISSTKGTAAKEFTVTANTSYVFSADVPAVAKSTASFTYLAKFPGSSRIYRLAHEERIRLHGSAVQSAAEQALESARRKA